MIGYCCNIKDVLTSIPSPVFHTGAPLGLDPLVRLATVGGDESARPGSTEVRQQLSWIPPKTLSIAPFGWRSGLPLRFRR